jgi:hypothetical protein
MGRSFGEGLNTFGVCSFAAEYIQHRGTQSLTEEYTQSTCFVNSKITCQSKRSVCIPPYSSVISVLNARLTGRAGIQVLRDLLVDRNSKELSRN